MEQKNKYITFPKYLLILFSKFEYYIWLISFVVFAVIIYLMTLNPNYDCYGYWWFALLPLTWFPLMMILTLKGQYDQETKEAEEIEQNENNLCEDDEQNEQGMM